jgi:hypothetical protein
VEEYVYLIAEYVYLIDDVAIRIGKGNVPPITHVAACEQPRCHLMPNDGWFWSTDLWWTGLGADPMVAFLVRVDVKRKQPIKPA